MEPSQLNYTAVRDLIRISGETERAAIVAWLRERVTIEVAASRKIGIASYLRASAVDRAFAYRTAADAIERGEHVKGGGE